MELNVSPRQLALETSIRPHVSGTAGTAGGKGPLFVPWLESWQETPLQGSCSARLLACVNMHPLHWCPPTLALLLRVR